MDNDATVLGTLHFSAYKKQNIKKIHFNQKIMISLKDEQSKRVIIGQ